MSIQERDRIRQIGGFVATALGVDWTVDTSSDIDHLVTIRRNDGATVTLRIGTYGQQNGRLIITGSLPGSYNSHRVSSPQITTATDKDPGKIAQDIERRLLPEYLPLLAEARERLAAEERAAASRAEALVVLAEVGAREVNGRIYVDLPGSRYGQIDLYHDGHAGRLDIGSVPLIGLVNAIKAIRDSLKEASE